MYKIIVKSCGKYHNVALGPRYCLTRKSAKKLIDNFFSCEAHIEVYKLIRIYSDIFCWTDNEEDKILDYYYDKLNEEDY